MSLGPLGPREPGQPSHIEAETQNQPLRLLGILTLPRATQWKNLIYSLTKLHNKLGLSFDKGEAQGWGVSSLGQGLPAQA